MKISEDRQAKLNKAIYGPITDLRIQRLRNGGGSIMDDKLNRLTAQICTNVKEALNIQE